MEVIRFAHNFLSTRGREFIGEFDKLKNLWYNFKKRLSRRADWLALCGNREKRFFLFIYIIIYYIIYNGEIYYKK